MVDTRKTIGGLGESKERALVMETNETHFSTWPRVSHVRAKKTLSSSGHTESKQMLDLYKNLQQLFVFFA